MPKADNAAFYHCLRVSQWLQNNILGIAWMYVGGCKLGSWPIACFVDGTAHCELKCRGWTER